ncbi:glycosyltransferase [bacterium]|nr:glycosyltransferase [bacterium]
MKIGIISVTKSLPWAAPDEVMLHFGAHAADQEHEIYYSAHPALEIEPRLPARHRNSISVVRRHAFRPARVHQFWQKHCSSFRVFERKAVDVIVVSAGSILDAFHQPEILLYAQRTKLPLVYFCHGHSAFYEIPDRNALRDLLGRMAALVFAADGNRKDLESQLAMDLGGAHVIRNACPFFLEQPLPWPAADSPARFAIVARLDAFWKGHETLLRVLSTPIWKSRDWLLDCRGEGKDRRYIGELAAYLGIADRVRIGGHTDDIKDVWRNNHALMLPTKAESLSLALLEAMMCGRPVVCSDVGDLGVVVKDGETGFLAKGSGGNDLAAAMEKFWQARAGWREMGLRAHRISCVLVEENPAAKLLDVLTAVAGSFRDRVPAKNDARRF